MPRPPRFSPQFPAIPPVSADFRPDAAASAAPRPADSPHPPGDEGEADVPWPGPAAPLAGRGQLLAPFGHRSPLPFGALLRRQGIEPSILPQPGQELDPGGTIPGQDQGADDAPQGVAAIEDAQVLAGDDPGLLAEQGHGELALGPERLGTAGLAGDGRQLRLAKGEPARDRQEPRGLLQLVEQGA